jgi:hypothetical protein
LLHKNDWTFATDRRVAIALSFELADITEIVAVSTSNQRRLLRDAPVPVRFVDRQAFGRLENVVLL